jgi:CRP-like cAMP-binding protein
MPIDNRLLARLPPQELSRLEPRLEMVPLHFKETLHEQAKPIDHVYFPVSGVVSNVTDLRDGGTVETGTIGREGMTGVAALLGESTSTARVFVQVEGRGYRLSARDLAAHLESENELLRHSLRYANVLLAMVSQTAACNRSHSLEERMARWLLMTRDRVDDDTFPLTQEFLGQMLGVRRPTVSLAGATLQKAGLIRYTRGRITILDRPALESASCECYAALRERFESDL